MNPFLLGKKNLSAPPLRALTTHLQPGLSSAATSAGHAHSNGSGQAIQPAVEVIKEGDKVVRLVVVCGCGERIEIECLYSGGA